MFVAGDAESLVAEKAIEDLCQLYYHPLYVFAVRTGAKPQDAMDLTQGFFEVFLRTRAYLKADRERGRLRSFLLASFRNYSAARRRGLSREKRGGGVEILPLEGDTDGVSSSSDPGAEKPGPGL